MRPHVPRASVMVHQEQYLLIKATTRYLGRQNANIKPNEDLNSDAGKGISKNTFHLISSTLLLHLFVIVVRNASLSQNWVKMQICCFKVDRGGKMYSRDGTENTRRCWGKDRWTPSCLQFNKTGFDQKRKYVVNYVEWSSWIQFHRCNTTKTPDQMICWIGMLPFTATVIEKFPNCIKIAKLSQKCAKH